MSTNYADLEKATGMDIGELKALQRLSFSRDIEKIPPSICDLTNLEEFICMNGKIREFPEKFDQLSNLKLIKIYNCPIESLPESFGGLHNIEKFSCTGTMLKVIPQFIRHLPNLHTLELSGNQIQSIPEFLFELDISKISLSYNQIHTIPDSFLWFYRSHTPHPSFDLRGNPLVPPYDFMVKRGCIIKYLVEKIELQQTLRELSEFSIQDIYLEDYPNLIPRLNRWQDHMQEFLTEFFHTFPLLDFIRKHLKDHETVPEICSYFPKAIVAEIYPRLREEFEDDRMPKIKAKFDALKIPTPIENSKFEIRL